MVPPVTSIRMRLFILLFSPSNNSRRDRLHTVPADFYPVLLYRNTSTGRRSENFSVNRVAIAAEL